MRYLMIQKVMVGSAVAFAIAGGIGYASTYETNTFSFGKVKNSNGDRVIPFSAGLSQWNEGHASSSERGLNAFTKFLDQAEVATKSDSSYSAQPPISRGGSAAK